MPAILVLLATSAHDHQRLNARLFADHSAALVVVPPVTVDFVLVELIRDRQNLVMVEQPRA